MNVVVLVGTDASALGEAAHELESDDTCAAVFVGDVTTPDGRAALHEFVTELFGAPRRHQPASFDGHNPAK